MNKGYLVVAFATFSKERVDASFEEARELAVYQVDEEEVLQLQSIHFVATQKKLHSEIKPCAEVERTRCGGRKVIASGPDAVDVARRVRLLADVSILVVQRAVHPYTALGLKQAGIFTVQLQKTEFIGAVLSKLQELIRLGTPRWMQVRMKNQAVEQAKGQGFQFTRPVKAQFR
jgi:hypothetical protein